MQHLLVLSIFLNYGMICLLYNENKFVSQCFKHTPKHKLKFNSKDLGPENLFIENICQKNLFWIQASTLATVLACTVKCNPCTLICNRRKQTHYQWVCWRCIDGATKVFVCRSNGISSISSLSSSISTSIGCSPSIRFYSTNDITISCRNGISHSYGIREKRRIGSCSMCYWKCFKINRKKSIQTFWS